MKKTTSHYNITREKAPAAIVNFLDDRIYEFNAAVTTHKDASSFAFTVRDGEETIIAGITGWTWAGICEITLLWIDERWRRLGIGRKLLETAELEAKACVCSRILVRSYSFQAPLFYQKYGYKIHHVLEDFPRGHKSYMLVKDMS